MQDGLTMFLVKGCFMMVKKIIVLMGMLLAGAGLAVYSGDPGFLYDRHYLSETGDVLSSACFGSGRSLTLCAETLEYGRHLFDGLAGQFRQAADPF